MSRGTPSETELQRAMALHAPRRSNPATKVSFGAFDRCPAGETASMDILLDGKVVGHIDRVMHDWGRIGSSRAHDYGVRAYEVEFTGANPIGSDREFPAFVNRRQRPTADDVKAALSAAKEYVRRQLRGEPEPTE